MLSTILSDAQEAAFSGDVRLLHRLINENNECVNQKDEVGHTPLHKACMNGWIECVTLLIEKGAVVNAADVAGCTPLHFAAANGYVAIARYLVDKAHANMGHKTNKGHTPRYMAKVRGQSDMVAFFNDMVMNSLYGPWSD